MSNLKVKYTESAINDISEHIRYLLKAKVELLELSHNALEEFFGTDTIEDELKQVQEQITAHTQAISEHVPHPTDLNDPDYPVVYIRADIYHKLYDFLLLLYKAFELRNDTLDSKDSWHSFCYCNCLDYVLRMFNDID